ncbi:hypothetical protein E4U11_001645 [Claviceps purpurea]|nr:hypothetical protein E4U11_001645 [Claviceps purpurea]
MASPRNHHAEKNHLPKMIQRLRNPKITTKQQRTDWMANRIKAYVDRDLKGKDLCNWNLHAFNESDLEVRREPRNFLKQRGIKFLWLSQKSLAK